MPIGNISKIVAIWQRLRRLSLFQWSMKRRPCGTCHMPCLPASHATHGHKLYWFIVVTVVIVAPICHIIFGSLIIEAFSFSLAKLPVSWPSLSLITVVSLAPPCSPEQDESQMKIFYRFLGHNKRRNRKKTKLNLGENQTEFIYSWKNNFGREI